MAWLPTCYPGVPADACAVLTPGAVLVARLALHVAAAGPAPPPVISVGVDGSGAHAWHTLLTLPAAEPSLTPTARATQWTWHPRLPLLAVTRDKGCAVFTFRATATEWRCDHAAALATRGAALAVWLPGAPTLLFVSRDGAATWHTLAPAGAGVPTMTTTTGTLLEKSLLGARAVTVIECDRGSLCFIKA